MTRPQFFATIAALFGAKASGQVVFGPHAAGDMHFYCGICKKWWKQIPSMANSACAVYHGQGGCCHYGQIEVPEPVDTGLSRTGPTQRLNIVPRISKPANGQCPVCGTLRHDAKPFPGEMIAKRVLVECEHCQNAFFQHFEFTKGEILR